MTCTSQPCRSAAARLAAVEVAGLGLAAKAKALAAKAEAFGKAGKPVEAKCAEASTFALGAWNSAGASLFNGATSKGADRAEAARRFATEMLAEAERGFERVKGGRSAGLSPDPATLVWHPRAARLWAAA